MKISYTVINIVTNALHHNKINLEHTFARPLFYDSKVIDDPFWGPYIMADWVGPSVYFLEINRDNIVKLLVNESTQLRSCAAIWVKRYGS